MSFDATLLRKQEKSLVVFLQTFWYGIFLPLNDDKCYRRSFRVTVHLLKNMFSLECQSNL